MDYKNTVFGEVTAESIQDLKKVERLGKGILELRIKRSEEVPLEIDHHDHHHDHHHHWSPKQYHLSQIYHIFLIEFIKDLIKKSYWLNYELIMWSILKNCKEIKKIRIYRSDRFRLIVGNGLGINIPAVNFVWIFLLIFKFFVFQLFSDIGS